MDSDLGDCPILEWEPADVHKWLSSVGFSQYESQLKDHDVDGQAFVLLNPEALKELGVSSIGQRLAILKAIYQLKIANNIPIEEDHYVPPSEATDRLENLTLERLHAIVQDQANRLRSLEDDNRQLNIFITSFTEDVSSIKAALPRNDEPGELRRQPSFKWAQFVKPQKSPTKPDSVESPHPSPQRLEHEIPYSHKRQNTQPPSITDSPNPDPSLKAQRQESSDNLKSFKVSLEDPTWKVLPAALKKYRINNDSWKNYAMFICYGPSGNRIERCLSYDEKPLLLFQRLKDSKKNPVFMLKHIKDIRSPIAVAQQKHAARKASSVISNDTVATQGHHKTGSASKANHRPPRLEVSDLSTSSGPLSTALTPQPGWPEAGFPSPLTDQRKEESTTTPGSSSTTSRTGNLSGSENTLTVPGSTPSKSEPKSSENQQTNHTSPVAIPTPNGNRSYAVAVYPYMAEQEDEFDVVVGDTFVILSRSRGWWIVQRDPNGTGIVEADTVKQGWVPAGCLLETSVPVASAIAQANAVKGSSGPNNDTSKTPILPLSIISTSFPGIALMDYNKKGEEELELVEGDQLRVFKRYNHWSYAVKEQGGDRGWVPSWFIGKVSNHSGTPNTPGSGTLHNSSTSTSNFEDITQAQVSPLSSAFPAVQPTRS
ncbi:Protein STE50 [Leucoagaricus sp. SymC.cos]|nr:Protein STE50 [Leucoagaricus sp. SymC.cos]